MVNKRNFKEIDYVFGVVVEKSRAKLAQELIINNNHIFKGINFIFEDINIK